VTLPDVIVIEETPSLARSVVTLLESDGLQVAPVHSVREVPGLLAADPSDCPVLVSASNGHYCESARRWVDGELGEGHLVVVGTRDPLLQSKGRLHVIALPLQPAQLIELIRKLLLVPRFVLEERMPTRCENGNGRPT
jgi:hypothetical protein